MTTDLRNRTPLYIAAQLENTITGERVWLPLPATTEDFEEALARIYTRQGNFIIREYNVRVPAIGRGLLKETPLALVNHLAARLEGLTDEEILKLCAIGDSDYYFTSVARFIDYTYNTQDYTLLRGITNETRLGIYYVFDTTFINADTNHKACINLRDFGKRLAEFERGAFTALGYVTFKGDWDALPVIHDVPDNLNLLGYYGENLYGELDGENDYEIYEFDADAADDGEGGGSDVV